uniref:Fork-head domain-containing protein n=1 Tax=Periophthalmus magnuspinnatus TaxID=409849 RepID=A0A3B4AMZ3_9GOBI
MKEDNSRERLGLSFTIDYLLFNKGVKGSEEEPPGRPTIEQEELATTTSSYSQNKSEEKPNQSYIALISNAILASEQKKLLLCDIYQWIMDHYPYFKSKDKNWRNSVRHNLSLNDCFIKAGRSDNGKGHFWAIHPSNYHDFSKGNYQCRRARRRVRRLEGQVPLSAPYHHLFGPRRPVCWCCPQSRTVTCLPTRLYWPWPHLLPQVGMYPLVHTSTS